jgi:hypothetical protein
MTRSIRLVREIGPKLLPVLFRAAQAYRAPWGFLVRRMAYLLRRGFKPDYAFTVGMLSPAFTEHNLVESLSKRELVRLQNQLNPASWTVLATDKSIFYRYCIAQGLPVPDLHAIWFRSTPGWSPAGTVSSPGEWEDLFLHRVPAEFVVKPSDGLYGYGFRLFRRDGEMFTDHFGAVHTAKTILQILEEDPRFSSYVVQSRLVGHPDLQRLSRTDALQCIRIVTLVERDGSASVIHAHMKIIVGSNTVDNIDRGKTGNIHGAVDLQSGTLTGGNIMTLDGSGNRRCTHHPGTGALLTGLPIPLWHEACALARKAAPAFFPLRTIGWDIGLTPSGPVLLEANNWYDPPPLRQGLSMRELVHRLESALPS